MNTKQLTYFLTLSKTKSIAATAKMLDIAQPSISQQIKNLEHEMGVVMFERNYRGVQLTQAGEKFVAHAQAIMNQYGKAKKEYAEPTHPLSGSLKIGMLESVANVLSVELVEALEENTNLELLLSSVPSAEMENLLTQKKLDIAIGYENFQPHPSLVGFPLIDENMFLVIRKRMTQKQSTEQTSKHREEPNSIPLWKLNEYELLTPDKDSSFSKILEYYEAKTGLALRRKGRYSGQLMTGLRQIIDSSMGLILPSSGVYRLDPMHQLAALKITKPEMTRKVVAFVHTEQASQPAISHLLTEIKKIVVKQNKKHYWRGKLLF